MQNPHLGQSDAYRRRRDRDMRMARAMETVGQFAAPAAGLAGTVGGAVIGGLATGGAGIGPGAALGGAIGGGVGSLAGMGAQHFAGETRRPYEEAEARQRDRLEATRAYLGRYM